MTQTVKGSDGKDLSDLKVVPLNANQINQPGSNKQSAGSPTTTTSSASGTSTTSSPSSTSSKKSAAAGTRHAQGESMLWMMVSTVMVSFFVGLMG